MQLVRQNGNSAAKDDNSRVVTGGRGTPGSARGRSRRRAIAAALLAGFLGSACAAQDPDGHAGATPQPGQNAEAEQVEKADKAARQAGPAGSLAAYVDRVKRAQAARAAAAKKWGLAKTPLPAPQPPTVKPKITTRKGFEVEDGESLPPVFTAVPVKEKIVFLTIDDGAEKDPELLRMMTDLKIPYSAFLSDYVISDNYGYFRKMRDRGVSLHNHTLNHRYLPGLSYDAQRKEICGQQDNLEKLYGKRPPLFRPPYGNYNVDTLRAAQSCGVNAVPLWAAEAFPDHMEWREWDQDLHPGDIILTHFRGRDDWKGSMPDMIRQVMKTVTDKGYAVARLEDYV
ncbi:polysaccharide deacetylase family protein [Streptomyces sp. NPDC004609]|uniref:polysaccharide deacetylase family protein n=1 Tax=Streptomyces sp. NPDC004609 TaxID=3364704 RepID=UPI0036D12E14